jgi:hypothetical protein
MNPKMNVPTRGQPPKNHLIKRRIQSMRSYVLPVGMLCAWIAGPVHSALVNVSPDSVNRLISGKFSDIHFDDRFSTNAFDTQRTLLETTNATFISALEVVLGPLGVGESYRINSATLTVGSESDAYTADGAKTARVMLVSWDSDLVTWNTRATGTLWASPGLSAGTEYSAAIADTGFVDGSQTLWTGLGATVSDWLSGSVPNYGLFFPDYGTLADENQEAAAANVTWTLDATRTSAVPAPGTLFLALTGLIGATFARRSLSRFSLRHRS